MRDANGLTPLDLAAEFGNMAMAENCQRSDAAMPLLRAVRAGHRNVAELLLAAGADPNAESPSGNSALIMAANAGDQLLVAALLQAGADTGLRNKRREQAHSIARAAGFADLAALLE